MKPDKRFQSQSPRFWAHVRAISEVCGYTDRSLGHVKAISQDDIQRTLAKLGLDIFDTSQPTTPTPSLSILVDYFEHRADILNDKVETLLMDLDEAQHLFQTLHSSLSPQCPLPENKQRGEKKGPAYFTCIINMLIESTIGNYSCDYDPRQLTKITDSRSLVRTFSRRVDGAFPSAIDPVAIWEIKEYYHTTTFGSRVAGGVYETLLDGMEIEELALREDIGVWHYLFVDSRRTWWSMGRSYLCRMVDMMHMGYVDEVLFGREVVTRLPEIASSWVLELERRGYT